MAIEKGLYASDLVSRVLFDLGDPAQKRWSADQVLKFINEAIRDLAGEGLFRRRDLHVAQAGRSVYETFAECARLCRAEFDFRELKPISEAEAEKILGAGWRSRTGAPKYFVPLRHGVRVAPTPDKDGTALEFVGQPTVSEEEGSKVSGEGMTGALWLNEVSHFAEDDGFVQNLCAATGNLLLEYAFFPGPSESGDKIPSRLADALVAAATMRCLSLSDAEEDLARIGAATGRWLAQKEALIRKSGPESFCESKIFSPMEAI